VAALDAHPHAAAVLGAGLAGEPSHAYLFAGPSGSGKRDAARAFAAELLGEHTRVMSGAHPDLTWVKPSGAAVMLRSDVADAVVSAAARTPFESARRVFVLESVDTMNDEAANTLLKTLEEPPSYVVLILLTDRPGQVLPTIASRCQIVRFDPAPPETIAARLSIEGDAALACARLSLGDGERAELLATPAGEALRAAAEGLVRTGEWRPILAAGVGRAAVARDALEMERDEELQYLPKKDQRRKSSEYDDRIKRAERRARTGSIDHALQLAGLWVRDLACIVAGADELVYNVDRRGDLTAMASGASAGALREALELIEETRVRFSLNVSEDLALEALSFRLQRTLA
jgi:DNA polymerase III subunit delta'